MAPQMGILIDISPTRRELMELREEKEKGISAAWKTAREDDERYRAAVADIDRYHEGDQTIMLSVWQKCWLRCRYPERKEYRSFEPAPFFEDELKLYWAAIERERIERLESSHRPLQPLPATTTSKPETKVGKGKGKGKEKKDEVPSAEKQARVQGPLTPQQFPTYQEWWDQVSGIDAFKKSKDLLLFDEEWANGGICEDQVGSQVELRGASFSLDVLLELEFL